MKRTRSALLAGLLAAALGGPATAHAQGGETQRKIAAEALYQQATAAMKNGSYPAACPLLEEVVRLQPDGLGAKLTLAECYERDSRLASAWTTYAAAESAAAKTNQTARRKKAAARVAALEPKLAHLTIDVGAEIRALPGLEIRRDDVPVGAVQWGMSLPADRGEHRITAIAGGKQRWETSVDVADGASASVRVQGLVDVPPPPPPVIEAPAPPLPPKDPTPPAKVAPPPPPPPKVSTRQLDAGVGITGVGAAGIIAGSMFGVLTILRRDQSNAGHCTGNVCDATGVELREEGIQFATRSTVLFVAGGIVLGVGVTLVATAPRDVPAPGPPPTAKVSVGPRGIEVGATW